MNIVGLLAGGNGVRFKSKLPKQFLLLDNKPIIIHTIDKFINLNEIDYIIIAVPLEYLKYTNDLVTEYYNTDKIKIISGGENRYQSLIEILTYLQKKFILKEDDIIITHDAVRPFINERIIKENIKFTLEYGAVDTVIEAIDTIVESVNHDVISNIPERKNMYQGQTPQSFKILELIKTCNSLTNEEKNILTDASKIYILKNKMVKLVLGEIYNIKITTEYDLKLANYILKENINK